MYKSKKIFLVLLLFLSLFISFLANASSNTSVTSLKSNITTASSKLLKIDNGEVYKKEVDKIFEKNEDKKTLLTKLGEQAQDHLDKILEQNDLSNSDENRSILLNYIIAKANYEAYLLGLSDTDIKIDEISSSTNLEGDSRITYQEAIWISENSVKVEWELSEKADGYVEYGKTSNYGKISNKNTGLSTKHTIVLTGLSTGDVYYYRIVSKNSSGDIIKSEGGIFRLEGTSFSIINSNSNKTTANNSSASTNNSGSAGTSIAGCPLNAYGSDLLFDFTKKDSRLTSQNKAGWKTELSYDLSNTILKGNYKISLASSDGYSTRVKIKQSNEVYNVEFLNNNKQIAVSGITKDLEDKVINAEWAGVVNSSINFEENINKIKIKHGFISTSGVNSLNAVCMLLESLDGGNDGLIETDFRISFQYITDIQANSAKISWSANKKAIGYVSYGKSESNLKNKTIQNSDFTYLNNTLLKDLDAGTKYYYKLYLEDEDNSKIVSTVYSFVTSGEEEEIEEKSGGSTEEEIEEKSGGSAKETDTYIEKLSELLEKSGASAGGSTEEEQKLLDELEEKEILPLKVNYESIKNISETSTEITLYVSRNSVGTIFYGKEEDNLDKNYIIPGDYTHELIGILTGLEKDTVYYYRVLIEDEYGNIFETELNLFKTSGGLFESVSRLGPFETTLLEVGDKDPYADTGGEGGGDSGGSTDTKTGGDKGSSGTVSCEPIFENLKNVKKLWPHKRSSLPTKVGDSKILSHPSLGDKGHKIKITKVGNTGTYHEYSQHSPWSAKGKYLITHSYQRKLYNGVTYKYIRTLSKGGLKDWQWNPTNDNQAFMFNNNSLIRYNVDSNSYTTIYKSSSSLAGMIGQGSISADGSRIAFKEVSGNDAIVRVIDTKTGISISSEVFLGKANTSELDFTMISPDGNYIVIMGNFNNIYNTSYSRTQFRLFQVSNFKKDKSWIISGRGSHLDIGYNSKGDQVVTLVGHEKPNGWNDSNSNYSGIVGGTFEYNIETKKMSMLVSDKELIGGSASSHISTSFEGAYSALSFYKGGGNVEDLPIFAIKLDGSKKITWLGWDESLNEGIGNSVSGYLAQPHASIRENVLMPDGRYGWKVAFVSDNNTNNPIGGLYVSEVVCSDDTSGDTNNTDSTDNSGDSSSSDDTSIDTKTGDTKTTNSGGNYTKFNPGHYAFADVSNRHSYSERNKRRLNFIKSYKNSSELTGFVIYYDWRELETSEGKYNLSNISDALNILKGSGKHLGVYVRVRNFSSSCSNPPVPNYLRGKWSYKFNGYVCMVKLFEDYPMNRLIALFNEFGRRFDNHPNFEMITFGETTIGKTSGFSDSKWKKQIIRFMNEAKKELKHTMINIEMNFLGSNNDIEDVVKAMIKVGGMGYGLPDTVPCRRMDIPKSKVCGYSISSYNIMSKYKGKVAITPNVETWDLIFEQTPEVYDMAIDYLGADHVYWQSAFTSRKDSRGFVGGYLDKQVIPTIRANKGRVHTTCPSSLAPCKKTK